ncbi:hypothetical protein KAZ66_05135, partial [Candidatus Woesebacteria bacterium]|nr:hypothetical protein [Candidatus Woesebacteria bacterium]
YLIPFWNYQMKYKERKAGVTHRVLSMPHIIAPAWNLSLATQVSANLMFHIRSILCNRFKSLFQKQLLQ